MDFHFLLHLKHSCFKDGLRGLKCQIDKLHFVSIDQIKEIVKKYIDSLKIRDALHRYFYPRKLSVREVSNVLIYNIIMIYS